MLLKIKKLLLKRRLSSCGANLKLYRGVVIHNAGSVSIGANVAIGDYVVIWGGAGLEIDEDVLIAAHSVISTQTHAVSRGTHRCTAEGRPIKIAKNAWIGAGAMILPGLTIGENAIIGAGSVVTKDVPANSVVAGNPAKVLRYI